MWRFEAAAGRAADFERAYGPDGDWVRLFSRSSDYRGTELLSDARHPGQYVTIDRWTSAAAFEAFKSQWKAEYQALDRRCESLTASETPLGTFEA